MRPGPSCKICALTLAPPVLFYALPHERYLGAICGLRIRRGERSLVDAAGHQVLELPLLPGVEEVGVHGRARSVALVVGGERRPPTSGWDGELEVRLKHRYGDWVGARALLNAVVLHDGVDHVGAVVGAVEQRPVGVFSEAVGELDAHHQLAVGALLRWSRRPIAVLAPPFDVLALHGDYL